MSCKPARRPQVSIAAEELTIDKLGQGLQWMWHGISRSTYLVSGAVTLLRTTTASSKVEPDVMGGTATYCMG
ncbi:hypothetical protein BN1723_005812 [Verticillium longisporum]|uniref:Uncharacterized protein n=1 Tax=Verticillium longisporum TaxID=100787 RepID=A0A0G4NBF5_VERLO|nr:hypothetical protein BN1723_005812 [Verticillium longisporum]